MSLASYQLLHSAIYDIFLFADAKVMLFQESTKFSAFFLVKICIFNEKIDFHPLPFSFFTIKHGKFYSYPTK